MLHFILFFLSRGDWLEITVITEGLTTNVSLCVKHCHGNQGEHDIPAGHAQVHSEQSQHPG